jgi:hypothetical protein
MSSRTTGKNLDHEFRALLSSRAADWGLPETQANAAIFKLESLGRWTIFDAEQIGNPERKLLPFGDIS